MPKLLAQVAYALCALLFLICAVGGVAIIVHNAMDASPDVFLIALSGGVSVCAVCFAVVAMVAVPAGDLPEGTNRAIAKWSYKNGF